MVFDDPSTEQPADFWLHPCDCLPLPWGSAWPADSLALENIPPGSNGSFIPPPFLIVSGAGRSGGRRDRSCGGSGGLLEAFGWVFGLIFAGAQGFQGMFLNGF